MSEELFTLTNSVTVNEILCVILELNLVATVFSTAEQDLLQKIL